MPRLGSELPCPIDHEEVTNAVNASPLSTSTERPHFTNQLRSLLDDNANIDLKSTYCNLPNAIVDLETKPGTIAFPKSLFIICYDYSPIKRKIVKQVVPIETSVNKINAVGTYCLCSTCLIFQFPEASARKVVSLLVLIK
ncbi:hypothetical protein A0J61_11451, partial [Choanephora cucurbitarum]